MTVKDDIDKSRRKFLLGATTIVGGLGVVAAATPFVAYWLPSTDTEIAGGPIQVDISHLQPAEQLTVSWRGKPVWIIRRTKDMIDRLTKLNNLLRDPTSETDQQPVYADNFYRARNPEFLILVGICTHLGCIPTYRPDVGSVTPTWPGGFYCSCHGSKYDLAGRVYKGVPAPLNLEVPPNFFLDEKTLVIGADNKSELA